MPEGYVTLVLQSFLPWGARISQPRAKFGRERGCSHFVFGGCGKNCSVLSCTGPAFPYPLAMVLQTRSGHSFWKKTHRIPPCTDNEEVMEARLPEALSKKSDWDHTQAYARCKACMHTTRKQARRKARSRCCIFDFANKPGRPQHNTQHNVSF